MKPKTIGFRCSDALRQQLESLAKQSRLSLSEYIVHVLSWAVQKKAVAQTHHDLVAEGKALLPPEIAEVAAYTGRTEQVVSKARK